MRFRAAASGLALLTALVGRVHADETVYVARGSNWRYLPGLSEASSPDPTAWRAAAFDDSAWAEAPAPFGYGESGLATDLGALSPPMKGSYSCLFLRGTFQVPASGDVVRLNLLAEYDDGFVVWINGVEVLRDNVPAGPLAFDGRATVSREARAFVSFDLPAPSTFILPGMNVIAVQAFNQTITSTDFKIDVEIVDPEGPDITPPRVDSAVPPPEALVRRLIQAEITFSEEVGGVDAPDLLVAGSPARSVSGLGLGPYVFAFDPPPPGPVRFSWASGHGIADISPRRNPFAGGDWMVVLDPTAALPDIEISEFLASNVAGLQDEDGDATDWIEIHNRGPAPASLGGWALTDDPDEPGKWAFPAVTIAPGEHRIVFASGKDRRSTGGQLHTSFQLNADGEYLGLSLFEAPWQVVSEYAPRFPEQRADVSYGRSSGGQEGYLESPTPGEPNGAVTVLSGIVSEPRFTPPRGFYTSPLAVEIHSPTAGAEIYYTTDGSEPTAAAGIRYVGPIPVAGAPRKGVVNLRAVAVRAGHLPSLVVTHTYIFASHVLTQPSNPDGFPATWGNTQVTPADYAMDPRVVSESPGEALDALHSIPSLSVSMSLDDFLGRTRGIYANPSLEGVAWERPCSAELIYPDGKDGFQVNCGIRIQGGSSTSNWKSPKLSMRLLFKGDYGPRKLRFPLFPDSAVGTFDSLVLDAHLNLTFIHPNHDQRVRSQYVRDAFVSDMQNAAGSLGPHGIFANLYVNGLYWGLYEVHERPDASFAAEHLGGDKDEYDAFKHNTSTLIDGNRLAWDEMFRRARAGLTTTEGYLSLSEYLDVRDLAAYMLVNLYAGNDDWAHQNWYAARRRLDGAGYRFFSWDAEHVLKDVNINQTAINNAGSPAELYTRLRQSPEYRLLFADQVHRCFSPGGPMYVDPSRPAVDPDEPWRNVPASIYLRRIDEIDPAIRLESARWGDARPNTARPGLPYTRDVEWLAELQWLTTQYFPRRSAVVLGQLRAAGLYPALDPPMFSHPGGTVGPGLKLEMSLPEGSTGTIYYTLDGSDPRAFGTGAVSPTAVGYAAPIAIDDTRIVKARTWDASTWSALQEASYLVSLPSDALVVSEIMYHPQGTDGCEFVELWNTGFFTIDLSGLSFTSGIGYTFPPSTTLAPGARLVLVPDRVAFESAYPGVAVGGVYEGGLSNGGEELSLSDVAMRTVTSVDYGDEGFWPRGPDGLGYSLVLLDPAGDPDDPSNWRASAGRGGSPGQADPLPRHGGIAIHEVLTRASSPFEDAVEFRNDGNRPVDIGGWFLGDGWDDETALKRYRIPAGTVVPAGGFAVLYRKQFGEGVPPLDLDERGGAVYLSSADAAGNLTGHIVGQELPAAQDGVSFGRVFRSTGMDFVPLEDPTFGVSAPASLEQFQSGRGAANAAPRVGPVVIHEIHYHPAPGEEEFVELHDVSGAEVDLQGWRLGGVLDGAGTDDFEFPPGARVPAGGFLVVVSMDPGLFRSRYGVPDAAPVVGPYTGALDNAGETLKLLRPYDGPGGAGSYILVDRVRYNDREPWPVDADGGGLSLERLRAAEYGNDPVNWAASLATGGTPGRANGSAGPGANQRPVPAFEVEMQPEPMLVLFDASPSRDPDGLVASHEWTFGDGAAGSGRTVLHRYPGAGVYTVTLELRDGEGAESRATRVVWLSEDAAGGLQAPGDGNQDGKLDLSDAVSLFGYLFLGTGRALPCEAGSLLDPGNRALLDVNADEKVDLTDGVYVLNYLFRGGPPPALGTACVRIAGCSDSCQ